MTIKQIECKLAELQACCKPDEVNLAKIHLAGLSAGTYKWGINTLTGDVFYNDNGVWVLYTAAADADVDRANSNSVNLSGNGTSTTPLLADVIISTQAGNTLQSTGSGLYVPAPVIPPVVLYHDDTNTLDLGGTFSLGQPLIGNVKVSTSGGNTIVVNPDGLYVPTPPSAPTITTVDTATVDLSVGLNPISANVKISVDAGNIISAHADGIYAQAPTPYELTLTTTGTGAATYDASTDTLNIPTPIIDGGTNLTVEDTTTINLTLIDDNLTADVIISPDLYNITEALINGVYSTPLYYVTRAQADSLITGLMLIPGQEYKISNVDSGLYGGTDIILKAATTNSFTQDGYGIFYNPIYNQAVATMGIWNNYNTFVSSAISGNFRPGEAITNNLGGTGTLLSAIGGNTFRITAGTWTGATSITGTTSGATATIGSIVLKTFTVGESVVYGGYKWTNVNGLVGTATNSVTLDSEWAKVPYDTINYNTVVDKIKYDYANNVIIKREDKYGNVVESNVQDNLVWTSKGYAGKAISVFQWGNPYSTTTSKGCSDNKVINSFFECVNLVGNFHGNMLNQRSIIQNNTGYGISLSNNTLKANGEIRSNTLHNASMNTNTLIGTFTTASTINSNVVYNAGITNHYLEGQSTVNSNLIESGFMNNNNLSYLSTINSNILYGSSAQIKQNYLKQTSKIDSNTLYTWAIIQGNNMENASTITLNTINANNGTFGNYIFFNDMSLSEITSNTITGNGGSNFGIATNTMKGITFSNTVYNFLARSRITGNLITTALIIGNDMYYSDISNLTTSSQNVYKNRLRNVPLDFTGITASKTLENADIDIHKISYDYTITFNGAAGTGAIGALTLPPFIVPSGYAIEEVIVSISTTLVGAGAIINLGISTDNPLSGLNNTTGDVATLNTGVITRVSPSTYTKSTANRTVTASVTTAAITSGVAKFIIRLTKL